MAVEGVLLAVLWAAAFTVFFGLLFRFATEDQSDDR